MKVRRFWYATSPRGRVAHMIARRIEGTRTFCGVMISTTWGVARTRKALEYARKHRCEKCVASRG